VPLALAWSANGLEDLIQVFRAKRLGQIAIHAASRKRWRSPAMALAVSAIMVVRSLPLQIQERAIGEPLRLHPSPAFGCP